MSGFLSKARTAFLGNVHELLDKAIDMNSIPVLKQNVRDLEDGIATTKHTAAMAAAQVTTLTRQRDEAQGHIEHNKALAQAFLKQSPPNENAARAAAESIRTETKTVEALTAQIADAQNQAQQLDAAVQRMQTLHDERLQRIKALQIQDQASKGLEVSTKALKNFQSTMESVNSTSVDNVEQRIHERNDLAKEEFNRTVGDIQPAADPIKDAEVDDILNSLRPAATSAKA
jgi:phage shock protein A